MTGRLFLLLCIMAPLTIALPQEQSPSSPESETEKAALPTFRLSGKQKKPVRAPDEAAPLDDPIAQERPAPEDEAAMKVGLVSGRATLSPELAEIAQQGALAVSEQNWEKARRHYLDLVKQAPDNALAYANLGVAEHQLGNLLAASGNLKKSLDLNPSLVRNWQTLGLIQLERGELELAISSLTRAIHEGPGDALSRLYLAAVIRQYGWKEAAIVELQRAIETDPTLSDAHYNLAMTYMELSPPRIELARRHYYTAIDLGSDQSPEIEAAFDTANQ